MVPYPETLFEQQFDEAVEEIEKANTIRQEPNSDSDIVVGIREEC